MYFKINYAMLLFCKALLQYIEKGEQDLNFENIIDVIDCNDACWLISI